jgi:hypothetical protein
MLLMVFFQATAARAFFQQCKRASLQGPCVISQSTMSSRYHTACMSRALRGRLSSHMHEL